MRSVIKRVYKKEVGAMERKKKDNNNNIRRDGRRRQGDNSLVREREGKE